MSEKNNNQTFNFATSTAGSTDNSSTLMGEAFHESKVWAKFLVLGSATLVAKGTKKSRELRNHGGNPLDDGMFSSTLRSADETDLARILDKEVVGSRVDALDSWLDDKGYDLFSKVTVHSLTDEEKALIESTVAELRYLAAFSDTSDRELFRLAMEENEKALLENRKTLKKAKSDKVKEVRAAIQARRANAGK